MDSTPHRHWTALLAIATLLALFLALHLGLPGDALRVESEALLLARPLGTTTLRIVRGSTGEPVPGAEVIIESDLTAKTGPAIWYGGEGEAGMRARVAPLLANRRGEVRTPSPFEYLCVFVRKGPLVGGLLNLGSFLESSDDSCTIELREERPVRIRVLDSAGRPRPGIPVAIQQSWGEARFPKVRARTSSSGGEAEIALFDHPLVVSIGFVEEEYWAALDLPCRQTPFTVRRIEEVASEPITLQLPPTGSVTVHVEDAAGNPIDGGAWVSLHVVDQKGQHMHGAPVLEGAAVFELVETGLELELTAIPGDRGADWVRARGFGPTRPGESIEFRLRFGERYPCFEGRFLNEAGNPLSYLPVTVHVLDDARTRHYPTRLSFRSDSAGRFRAFLDWSTVHEHEPIRICFQHRKPWKWAFAPLPRPLRSQTYQLGDLRLR